MNALPKVVSNSEVYGNFKKGHLLEGIPIAGLIGDQQAALVGNKCLTKGDAKQTYGSSSPSYLSLPSGTDSPSFCTQEPVASCSLTPAPTLSNRLTVSSLPFVPFPEPVPLRLVNHKY